MNELSCGDPGGPIAVRKWIGDVSAERVGQEWRMEDHEALLRAMRAADELTFALVARARGDASETRDRKSTRLNSSHSDLSRMPSSA